MPFMSENRFKVGIALAITTLILYFFDVSNLLLGSALYTLFFYEQAILWRDIPSFYPIEFFTIIIYVILGIQAILHYNVCDKDQGIFLIGSVTISDILQYYAGRNIGRIKIGFPSPNKTIEGYVVGILLSIAIFWAVGYDAVVPILLGVLGDFFISIVKRRINVKDVSSLLGEHGGLLDRCDGIFMTVIMYHYLL